MSTRGGYRSKYKKHVQTTLGRAPQNRNMESLDLSHLKKPIDTSLFGLTQVLSLFETATDEVRRYIAHECDLMFECRICRTIFRSVANFILHKRNYCREVYNLINDDNKSDFESNDLKIVNKDSSPSSPDGKGSERTLRKCTRRDLHVVLEKLSDKRESHEYTQSVVNEELTANSCPVENEEKYAQKPEECKAVYLEGITSSKEGVFQTIGCDNAGEDLMKSEVMEIHSILNTNEAILGPDGKVFTFKSEINNTSGQKLTCTICNLKFSTKKTLTHHIKYKHNDTRLIYICPDCKDSFANAWCVFRHLYKVHRKTTAQIRRMRDQIHSNAIVKRQEPTKKKTPTVLEIEMDVEEDSQCCEGCGKRFDRKAALHSHTQMCLKRLALNAAKESQKHTQDNYKQKTNCARGASKRKPNVSQKIVRRRSLDVNLKDTKDKTALVEDTAYQRHLVQEIILGSRGSSDSNSSLCKKFIGFISDEEEILGFVKGNNIQMSATNKTINVETNTIVSDRLDDNYRSELEDSIKHPPLPEKVDISSTSDDLIIHIDESETTRKDTEDTFTNELLKATAPRQYSSKKNKPTIKDLSPNENKDEPPPNVTDNNNANTTEIDLPYDVESDNVISIVDCDLSDSNETLSVCSSDSDSCSCFDERSNDCKGSSSNTVMSERVSQKNISRNEIDAKGISDLEQNCGGETIEILSDLEDFAGSNKENQCETAIIEQNINSSSSISSTVDVVEDLDTCLGENKTDMKIQCDAVENVESLKEDGDKETIVELIEIDSDLEDLDEKNRCKTAVLEDIINENLPNTEEISENLEQNLAECNKNATEFGDSPLLKDVNKEILHKRDLSMPENNSEQHLFSDKQNTICVLNKRGTKRKYSDSSTISDSPDDSLREQCENYVDWTTLTCQACLNTFETSEKLLEHMALHFNWLQYECTNCNCMFYDRNSCKQHSCHANTEVESPDDAIVTLPLWKTISMSTPFTNLVNENDCLSDIIEEGDSEMGDEESTLTCNPTEIKTQDPSLRKMIMEVIFGPQDTATEPALALNTTRPIRNRKSIRTVQKDFEYDMKQIDSKVRKPKNKIKPIKIVKNSDLNFHIVTVTSEESKKKRTDD